MQGFFLPWVYLALDLLLGNPLKPDLLGIAAGHLYYFLTVLHPLAGGRYILKTPLWVYPFHSFLRSMHQISFSNPFCTHNLTVKMVAKQVSDSVTPPRC